MTDPLDQPDGTPQFSSGALPDELSIAGVLMTATERAILDDSDDEQDAERFDGLS